MPFRFECACARHLNDVAAPFSFVAVELDEGTAPAHAVPCFQRQVLHTANADAAIDRHVLALHKVVIGRIRTFPGAVTRILQPLWFMPMFARWHVMHWAGSFVVGFKKSATFCYIVASKAAMPRHM